jgi:hypothetical protein
MENTRVFSLLIIWFNLSDTMVQLLAHPKKGSGMTIVKFGESLGRQFESFKLLSLPITLYSRLIMQIVV